MVKFVLKYCVQKELLKLKDSKLTQNFYGNKTGFVRPGHIYSTCIQLNTKLFSHIDVKPEPIMLLNLPIILSRISQKCYLLFSKSIL